MHFSVHVCSFCFDLALVLIEGSRVSVLKWWHLPQWRAPGCGGFWGAGKTGRGTGYFFFSDRSTLGFFCGESFFVDVLLIGGLLRSEMQHVCFFL